MLTINPIKIIVKLLFYSEALYLHFDGRIPIRI